MLRTVKKIFSHYIHFIGKRMFIFVCIFGTCFSIFAILEPLFIWKIIKELELFYKTNEFDTNKIIFITLFWWVFIVVNTLLKYIYFQYLINIPTLWNYKLLVDTYVKKIIGMRYGEYLGKQIGKISKIVDTWVEASLFFLSNFFEMYLVNLISIFAIIGVLFVLDIRMLFLSISMFPFMLYFGYIFSVKNWVRQEAMNKKWEWVFYSVWEAMSNFTLVKALTLESNFFKRIDRISWSCLKEQIIIDRAWSISEIYTFLLIMISRMLVLWFWIFFVISGTLDLATLLVSFFYLWFIYFPLSHIFTHLRTTVKEITDIKRMFDEFDKIEWEGSENIGKRLNKVVWNIEFKDVGFSYSESIPTIQKLTFDIKSGQKIALVWNTWAGKSTIANLLLRLWDVDSWEILLDGININELNKKSLRNHIGIVSQDNTLFNMTIKENLLFANPKASKSDLEDALKKAEAGFVFDFLKWLDTVIWERGLKLSGWEKQRLSIARLFLRNPEILILDEATSALDNKTEKLIQKALDTLTKWKTSIVIAHRLSTIKNADRIFMVEKWKIVESWSYDQLMNKKEKFYSLANPEHFVLR